MEDDDKFDGVDYALWLSQQRQVLLDGRLADLDVERLIGLLADLEKSQKSALLWSSTRLIEAHVLRQSGVRLDERWATLLSLDGLLEDSPSLSKHLGSETFLRMAWLNAMIDTGQTNPLPPHPKIDVSAFNCVHHLDVLGFLEAAKAGDEKLIEERLPKLLIAEN